MSFRVRVTDSRILCSLSSIYPPQIWDIARQRIRYTFEGHQQDIYSLDFSHDGAYIVSGSADKTARIWDMNTHESKVLTIDDDPNVDAGVTSVAISPDARFVAAGSLDTIVRIWDVATGMLVDRLRGHGDSVYSVAFTPDGKGLVSGSLDKTLKYWAKGSASACSISLVMKTMCSVLPSRMMANGSSLVRRIVVCGFGI